ncbi:ATP-binding protein [Massilia niabensis]|uniref:histidine kinase n=1 Tax=Massilia niabensis TaxID=544910 RepID=A0ABW0L2V5_9BURK
MSLVPAEPMPVSRQVDLASCADEPIHTPGSIQPHGFLLFMDSDGLLAGWSANVPPLLLPSLQLGRTFRDLSLPASSLELVADCAGLLVDGECPPAMAAVSVEGRDYDAIVHATGGRIIAEFELRAVPADEVALFAVKAHSSIERVRRQRSIEGLLETAVRQVREFTGFDRVMAYRFRPDESGDVVAEARREDLPAYLGQRYPAGDIPAQARRLYVLNTLRTIANVGYTPVPLLGTPNAMPLDMSFAVLRSVSPIHAEYLRNMGVHASMSVSIVINGRLWGLIACHHMAPKAVPYAIRMAADVLAQVMASTIQSIEARLDAELVERAARVRTDLVESLLTAEEPLDALASHAQSLLDATGSQALVCLHNGRMVYHGLIGRDCAATVARGLPPDASDMLVREHIGEWPEEVQPLLGKWVGMLALPFDPPGGGWCLLLRTEQIEHVLWAGRPEKSIEFGPNGPRLTPRGSFDAWHETVVGRAHPWEAAVLDNARLTLSELLRASNARRAQTESARAQLLAMLGHDLRDPLQSINMAGTMIERGSTQPTLGRRIQSSSDRMQRLIGQVLDMSRIDGGLGLGMQLEPLDLAALTEDVVDEMRVAYPAITYDYVNPGPVMVRADGGRIAQVLSNLLSNARHHGYVDTAINVALSTTEDWASLDVTNEGDPIPDEFAASLFNPFKRGSLHNLRNRTGMGLGLYIVATIVREHQGEIAYRFEDGEVVFSVRLPLAVT